MELRRLSFIDFHQCGNFVPCTKLPLGSVGKKKENKATSGRDDGHYVNARLNLIDDLRRCEIRLELPHWPSVSIGFHFLRLLLRSLRLVLCYEFYKFYVKQNNIIITAGVIDVGKSRTRLYPFVVV